MEINNEIVDLIRLELDNYIQWLDEQKVQSFPETDIWAIELFIDFLQMEAEINANKNRANIQSSKKDENGK